MNGASGLRSEVRTLCGVEVAGGGSPRRFRSAGKPPFSMAKRFPEDSGQGANNAD